MSSHGAGAEARSDAGARSGPGAGGEGSLARGRGVGTTTGARGAAGLTGAAAAGPAGVRLRSVETRKPALRNTSRAALAPPVRGRAAGCGSEDVRSTGSEDGDGCTLASACGTFDTLGMTPASAGAAAPVAASRCAADGSDTGALLAA
jgi:hypothetical protein